MSRRRRLRVFSRHRREARLHRPERQSRPRLRGAAGARDRLAGRAGCPRDQRQPHPEGLASTAAATNRAPSVATLANAMDVGNPSNFERLISASARSARPARRTGRPTSRSRRGSQRICASGYVWCPHSATAVEAWTRVSDCRALGAAVDRRRDRASLQIRRDGRAAHRPRGSSRPPRLPRSSTGRRARSGSAPSLESSGEALHERGIAA